MASTDNFNEPPGGILWETGENVKDFITSIVKAIGGLVFSLIDGALFVSTGDGSSIILLTLMHFEYRILTTYPESYYE